MQHWRLQANARVSKPVGIMSVSIGCAAMLRSAMHGLMSGKGLLGTIVEVVNVSVYPTLLSLPAMAVHSGCTTTLLQPACIASHVIRSLALWSVGMGLAPAASGVVLPLRVHIELVLELALGIQDQMSLPIMAVLHALRQAGWMSIVIWCMEGDPYRTVIRGVLNWMVMMLLTGLFELRTWSAYQKHCRAQQQLQEQEQLLAPAQLLSLEASPEFISDLPSPDKPAKGQGGSGNPEQDKRPISPDDRSSTNRARPLAVLHPSDHDDKTFKAAQRQAVDSGSAPAAKPRQASIAYGFDGSSSTVDGGASLVVGASQLPASAVLDPGVVFSATGTDGITMPCSLPGRKGLGPHIMPSSQSILQIIDSVHQQHTLGYRSRMQRAARVVHVKVEGLELEQLPADLPRLMHSQLSHCMPGVSMSGLALRSGCVLMTIDLLAEGSMAISAEGMRLVMAQLMHSSDMDRELEDGATMHVQSPDELMLCQWDTARGGYMPAPEPTSGALDPASLAAYGLIGTLPAVLCLGECPPTADSTATHQLTLTVELELPSNCPLHGWQPDAALGSAGVEQEDGAVMHAMLLARRLDGGYLPVVVERVTQPRTGAGMQVANLTTVQVTVTLDAAAPAALNLELWCKQLVAGDTVPTAGNELLVSHMPVLVLPGSWKEAAAELQQLVTDMGGVQPYRALAYEGQTVTSDSSEDAASSLLHDMGLYLTHSHRLSMATQADTPSALPDATMAQLGADLLVYAVRQRLGAVAGMIVDTMQQAEQPSGAILSSEPPPKPEWLLLAAGCQPSTMQDEQTSLLHAAMASGNRSILEMVLKWGSLYGGPWWAWPWELEDAKGCTALHMAAAQPASTCIGLLDTLTSTLPAAQRQAARSAWLHCPGSVNLTPAELFARGSNGPTAGAMWHNQAAASTSVSDPSAAGSSSTSSVPAASLPLHARTGINDQSWLGSMVDAWTMRNTQEYRAWAQGQMSGLVRFWAATMTIITPMALSRSILAGCKLYEAPHLILHNIGYIPMAMATSGVSWLGSWQNWMVAVHAFHAMAYLAKCYLPNVLPVQVYHASAWYTSGHNTGDAVYVLLLTAVLDQSPLPPLAIAQTCVAYCHGLAYASAGVPHPMLRSFIVHGLALVVTTLSRAWQLRAYRRWQVVQESNKQAAARAQIEKKAKME